MLKEIIYSFKDIVTCDCKDKETPISYGNQKDDKEPQLFKAQEDDKCQTCGKVFKFKERKKVTITIEEVKI